MAYAEPTGFLEVLPILTSPASMVVLEAAVERIQNLYDNHLAAHHVVNSFVRHNITPLQRRSCPHWEVLSRNHPMRLHLDSPSEGEILMVSNFLTGGNRTELLRPLRILALVQIETEECAAIIASMPLCDEWGLVAAPVAPEVAAPAAPEVATREGSEELTMTQRSRLVHRLLVAQETIEEDERTDALVHLPWRRMRPSHLVSPRASVPGMSSTAGASTSSVIPVSGPSTDAASWDDLEWGCLLDSPR
jgi:hypothetical protein